MGLGIGRPSAEEGTSGVYLRQGDAESPDEAIPEGGTPPKPGMWGTRATASHLRW